MTKVRNICTTGKNNSLSFAGLNDLIEKLHGFDVLEFSTADILDIHNIINQL